MNDFLLMIEDDPNFVGTVYRLLALSLRFRASYRITFYSREYLFWAKSDKWILSVMIVRSIWVWVYRFDWSFLWNFFVWFCCWSLSRSLYLRNKNCSLGLIEHRFKFGLDTFDFLTLLLIVVHFWDSIFLTQFVECFSFSRIFDEIRLYVTDWLWFYSSGDFAAEFFQILESSGIIFVIYIFWA